MRIYKARKIGRSIQLSHCNGQRLNEQGDFEDFHELVMGSITPKSATRYFRKVFADDTITVNNVETDVDYYSMPIEDFIAGCIENDDKEN